MSLIFIITSIQRRLLRFNRRVPHSSPVVAEMLEYPLVKDLFSIEQLDVHGAFLASSHRLDRRLAKDILLGRLAENERILKETRAFLIENEIVQKSIFPAGVWLLDNFFLIQEQIELAREHLPKRYSRELPRLRNSIAAGLPRVYEIAQDLISHIDGKISEEHLRTMVVSYQRKAVLNLGELWAIPIMLRLALIENLRSIALRIAASRRECDVADFWAEKMLTTAEKDPKNIILDIADMARANIFLSCSCVAEILRKLQSHNPAVALALTWIEQRLTEQGTSTVRMVQLDSQQQAINQIAMGNSITSLRLLATIDWEQFVESVSLVEAVLRTDPAGTYGLMNFATRDAYRHVIESLAKRARISEEQVARTALQLAQEETGSASSSHVGTYLMDRTLRKLTRTLNIRPALTDVVTQGTAQTSFVIFAGTIAILTTALTFAALRFVQVDQPALMWLFGMLLFIGFSQAVIACVNWVATLVVKPILLPKMDFSNGIPLSSRTLVTVPALLSSTRAVKVLLDKIEVCFLANRAENIYFSLLTDFNDAPEEHMPNDSIVLDQMRSGIDQLNRTYGTPGKNPFFLFHRSRVWNVPEKCWMGYERKRGKLEALNTFIRTKETSDFLQAGDYPVLSEVKYILTLDSDTDLPRDSARHLIEAMAHPLNMPVYDSVKNRIVDGYAILQPRIVSSLPVASASWYSRIFSSDAGLDPYTRAVSDVYQDLFGEGSFIGKGIYDIDAFSKVISYRFPDNRILSHDLLEGTYCRSGLVSDVALVDEFPERYSDDCKRRHRWIRGDWQIAAWLLPWVPACKGAKAKNTLSVLSKFKILDNLRRSISPIALTLLMVLSWGYVRPVWLMVLLVGAILVVPGMFGLVMKAFSIPARFPLLVHIKTVAESIGIHILQSIFAFAVLPYEAFTNMDATIRSWWRMGVSHRNLLQWEVSGRSRRTPGKGLFAYYQLMGAVPLVSLILLAVFIDQKSVLIWLVCGVWLLSPLFAWLMSRPYLERPQPISAHELGFLKKLARKTWRYFETFAGAENNWLPADNFQEHPRLAEAHRTSPTNIGLMLLSNLGAYDMGYICAGKFIDLTQKSFKSMAQLTRYHGHFLNWYDTQTLKPMAPEYVSTVDSGNLTGYVLTLKSGILEMQNQPFFTAKAGSGLCDTFAVFSECIVPVVKKDSPASARISALMLELQELLPYTASAYARCDQLRALKEHIEELRRVLEDRLTAESAWWIDALHTQCTAWHEEINFCMPWLGMLNLPEINSSVRDALEVMGTPASVIDLQKKILGLPGVITQQIDLGVTRAYARTALLLKLAQDCQNFAEQEYGFLYDASRHLLAIGYDVANRRRDDSFYDLLASESRLGSFVGIAQGKLPVEHWFSLGRLVTMERGKTMLLSWGGSMFEYLMPLLIMPRFDKTLLGQTCRAVVDRHIAYGNERGVPWGISESAENSTDANLNYQYRSFGVPGLGFKRDLADDLVISPYASALALMVKPREACSNLLRLSELGYMGKFGMYEAIDYTPGRLSGAQTPALITSFMAHHQGMSFVSLVNFLNDNPMPQRFAHDPLFRTTTLLLTERVPKASPFELKISDAVLTREIPGKSDAVRIFTTPDTVVPEVHLLSNGTYHVMITNAGGGYSKWGSVMLTRWREDTTLDNYGTFVYIKDLTMKHAWSSTFQPSGVAAKNYEAIFSLGRAEFKRKDAGITTHTEIAVSPEDDIEYRRITLANFTGKAREIELTSFAEVVLAPQATDQAHPSFSNLFVQTELLTNKHAILASRRPRSPGESHPWLLHLFTTRGLEPCELSYETNRQAFIGRSRSVRNPAALDDTNQLSNAQGSVLDPSISIRCKLTIPAGETVIVGYITGAAPTRERALDLIDKYQDKQLADRVFDMAIIHGKVLMQQLGTTDADSHLYGRLTSPILYANRFQRAHPQVLLKNLRGQSSLWAYGISGDLPLVLLRMSDSMHLRIVTQLIGAHAYWRLRGVSVDLVIWNEERSGYRQNLGDQIAGLIAASSEASLFDKAGGIFVRYPDQMPEEDQTLMLSFARVVIQDTKGTLADQLEYSLRYEVLPAQLSITRTLRLAPAPADFIQDALVYFNGWGGFTPDGKEYVVQLQHEKPTPAPWVNVIANSQFGTVVSPGGGYTWFENAHEFRLTPWYNDSVRDCTGEVFYLRDEITGKFWSLTPQPAPGEGAYLNRQGFGYSVFEYTQYGLKTELWIYVDTIAPVKFWMIKIRNDSEVVRKVSVTGFLELCLGEHRSKTEMHIRTEIDAKTGALLASNSCNPEFAGCIAFFDVHHAAHTQCGDRTEFLGRNGTYADPAALHRSHLSGRVGSGLDPAAIEQVYFELQPGEEKEIVFILGVGRDIDAVRNLLSEHRGSAAAHAARDRVWHYWSHTLGTINIETPDKSINIMANGWLMYQTIAARLWGRSGYYQSGGAFGFRDQLQDVLSLVHAQPACIREQLLLCASRQFIEGDVQHWWHPPAGKGVRTKISDDLLWLPFVASAYVEQTGDTGILDEEIYFLTSRMLKPDEDSLYDLPLHSLLKPTLYEHCKQAIIASLRFGQHELPLMGSGDWNDGMNLVGVEGKGESVWLAFFLYAVLERFSPLAQRAHDTEFILLCEKTMHSLSEQIEAHAWDGRWYVRAFYDNGSPLGAAQNTECRIDAIAQSWSVLSGAGSPLRSVQAMASLEQFLVDKQHTIIKLLDPPFNTSDQEPGYIKGYVPGVRENGGQYTHAAIWAVMAFARMGDARRSNDLLSMINPINHSSTHEKCLQYMVEPYVMAADIYGSYPHAGRGGWTWYTGSASWMYRLIIESILGINLKVNTLTFTPCMPEEWPQFTVHYRFHETVYHITVKQIPPGSNVRVTLDGTVQEDGSVHLLDDPQEHRVLVEVSP